MSEGLFGDQVAQLKWEYFQTVHATQTYLRLTVWVELDSEYLLIEQHLVQYTVGISPLNNIQWYVIYLWHIYRVVIIIVVVAHAIWTTCIA